MADTVKKSRIVSETVTSDDNLEEALMEEFNMRLKNCMSQDDLRISEDDQSDTITYNSSNRTYENVGNNIVKPIKITPTTNHNVMMMIPSNDSSSSTTKEFIEIEKENYYAEPRSLMIIKNEYDIITSDNESIISSSQMKQQEDDDKEEEQQQIHSHNSGDDDDIYENIEQSDQQQQQQTQKTEEEQSTDQQQQYYVDMQSKNNSVKTITNNENDQKNEENTEEHYYDIPIPLTIGTNNYPVPPTTLVTTDEVIISQENNDAVDDEIIMAAKSSVKDRMFLSTDDSSCLLFTQTVTSPMLTPSEENIDFLKGFQRESTMIPQKDSPESTSNLSQNDDNQIGAESATTTSELPSAVLDEENIYENSAFLKENNSSTFLIQERIYENLTSAINPTTTITTCNDKDEEEEEQKNDEIIYENLRKKSDEVVEDKTTTLQTDDDLSSHEESTSQPSEQICSKTEDINSVSQEVEEREEVDHHHQYGVVIVENNQEYQHHQIVNREKDTETVPLEIVKNLKSQFNANNNNGDSVDDDNNDDRSGDGDRMVICGDYNNSIKNKKTTKTKKFDDIDQLKEINIMKQINKFEHNNGNTNNNHNNINDDDEDNEEDEDNDDSSQQVSESYVETTTYESISPQDKALKKKKSKKSRKEEKENISVNGTTTTTNNNYYSNSNYEDLSFYNVNVKNLCRSFGDLSKIGNDNNNYYEKLTNINNYYKRAAADGGINKNYYTDNRTRTKSLSDIKIVASTATSTSHTTTSNKILENVFTGVSVRTLKSSFNKFDALQKKNNVLHVRSSDSTKAQEKFNGAQIDTSNCKSCDKAVFQMEQIKAEKAIWHKNCFRCTECSKQLNVDTYQSHEGTLYCKPHFKALFAPKVVEDDPTTPVKSRKPELIIRENQPLELPPDVVRASDKPDLGLEELQSLNVKERFQVFEHYEQQQQQQQQQSDLTNEKNVKRSPSILSKLAKFQAKGMDIGVTDDSLNGIPIEESTSEEEDDEEAQDQMNADGNPDYDGVDDVDLIRAKRVQKEKPFHFTGMSDVKNKWEHGEQHLKDERREERKQEIQTIRNRLFLGKQVKMKEAYEQAVMESESCTNLLKNNEPIEVCDTKSLKERFEKGELINEGSSNVLTKVRDNEDSEVYESEMSKNSRSLFLELDANASKAPQITSMATPPASTASTRLDVKKAREAYLSRTSNEDVIKSSTDQVDDVQVRTADIQERFKFFETYKEPEATKKSFRITPPRDGQIKAPTPDREIYHDPDIVRADEETTVEDSVVAKQSHTATKMLNKFRQMEENLHKETVPVGPKPLKRFTPPPEPVREEESSSEGEGSSSEEDEENDDGDNDQTTTRKYQDEDLIEAQKAARAKQLRAKFERWEANEIKKEQEQRSNVVAQAATGMTCTTTTTTTIITGGITQEFGDEQSQVESTKSLRARFESMRDSAAASDTNKAPRVKVNRFLDLSREVTSLSAAEQCASCQSRVYPLEKIAVHGHTYHKRCFKCMECSCVLRMDSYAYNQGLLYCKPHFKRLFISKGNYDTAFGLGQYKEKWMTATASNNGTNASSASPPAVAATL